MLWLFALFLFCIAMIATIVAIYSAFQTIILRYRVRSIIELYFGYDSKEFLASKFMPTFFVLYSSGHKFPEFEQCKRDYSKNFYRLLLSMILAGVLFLIFFAMSSEFTS